MSLSLLKPEIETILSSEETVDSKLENICHVLKQNVKHYDWVGFYFKNGDKPELKLKTYAGKPTDHIIIPFGKGICGQVAVRNENFLVEDVSAQDNYIACSIDVKSEIVIPLFVNGENIGQIDIDSNTANAFTQEDENFLVWLNAEVAKLY